MPISPVTGRFQVTTDEITVDVSAVFTPDDPIPCESTTCAQGPHTEPGDPTPPDPDPEPDPDPTTATLIPGVHYPLTPGDFGAIGDGTTDDTVPCQDFWNYVAANRVLQASFAGDFRITSQLIVGDSQDAMRETFETPVVQCSASITPDFVDTYLDAAVVFQGCRTTIFAGVIKVEHKVANGSVWPDGRAFHVGVAFNDNVRHTHLPDMYVAGARMWGVQKLGATPTHPVGSNSRVRQGMLYMRECGLCSFNDDDLVYQRAVVSETDNGDSHGRERSTLTLDGTLPPHLEDNGKSCVVIGERVYGVDTFDETAQTITIFPRLAGNAPDPAVVTFAIGGGCYSESVDFSLWKYEVVDATFCGIGWYDRNSYGNLVGLFHGSRCGIAGLIGRFPDGWTLGGGIQQLYLEDTGMRVRGFPTWGESGYTFAEASVADGGDFYRIRANGGSTYRADPFPGTLHRVD